MSKVFNGWGYTCHHGRGAKMVAILESDAVDLKLLNSLKWQKSTGCLPGFSGEVGDFIKEEVFYVAKAEDVVVDFEQAKISYDTHFKDYDMIHFGGDNIYTASDADTGNKIGSMVFKLLL